VFTSTLVFTYFPNPYRNKHDTTQKLTNCILICATLLTRKTSVKEFLWSKTPYGRSELTDIGYDMWNLLSKGLWHRRLDYLKFHIFTYVEVAWNKVRRFRVLWNVPVRPVQAILTFVFYKGRGETCNLGLRSKLPKRTSRFAMFKFRVCKCFEATSYCPNNL
jgi:hypothetical protein